MDEFELSKAYDAQVTEEKWYQFWEKGGFFRANALSEKPPYCIVIPPPNVTGMLHMGHALVNTLQDILIRWKRMSGFEALWVPGTDHAGIATQTVVERHLLATENKRRNDYTREEFLHHVWNWKEKSEKIILSQLKKLGCSCDWSRLRFTMDEGCNRAVRKIFKQLYDDGLIYKGEYLVNWDPVTQTALADDEVEYEERQGHLWFFKYHLVDNSGYVRIATTRPETMLGDTAVAVSPKDPRYTDLIGRKVHLPIVGREIPVIADHHVDPAFGTGMIKVTPAHDPNDYRIGVDHNLPMINIFTPAGFINENGGPYKGMSREEARFAVVKEMDALGLLEKVESHTLRIGLSYRSKAVIEPYLSKQWFVNTGPFIPKLREAVEKHSVTILPPQWETTYFHWVNHLRDWCISRQLWWGHRIPVWYRKDRPEERVCYAGDGIPPEVVAEPEMWEQDPDVLDTWFSSALWPFSTLGWPDKEADLQKFYPTSVLVTGHDILFFWVARMIMMGEYALGHVPFSETFLHGLIYGKSYWKVHKGGEIVYITGEEKKEYDLGKTPPPSIHSKWEKLSKSKGNVIDPLEMIAEYGTDAVRISLCACANQTPQIDLDRRRFEEYKNFANKIWNGARFVFMNLEGLSRKELSQGIDRTLLSLEDLWILSAINQTNRQMNEHLAHYRFDQAAELAYNFFWKQFCAYYVEMTKPILFHKAGTPQERTNKQKMLVFLLTNLIRLLHPIVPFITEELFQLLKRRFPTLSTNHVVDPYTRATVNALVSASCVIAPYPQLIEEKDIHPDIENRFTQIEEIVYTMRNIRAEMEIPPGMATDLYILGPFQENPELLRALVKINQMIVVSEMPLIKMSAIGVVGAFTLVIPLPEELAHKERARLTKEREKALQMVQKLSLLLKNPEFHEKAQPELVERQKNSLTQAEAKLAAIDAKLTQF